MHRRLALLVLVLGLVAAACGGTVDGSTTSIADAPPATTAPGDGSGGATTVPDDAASGSGPDDGSTPSVTLPPGGTIDGPTAPDFTIALGQDRSESFTLSQGARPVYMVFWAEW